MRDISNELSERLVSLQEEADAIKRKRQELDAQEREVENRLQALKTTMEWERVLHGKSNGRAPWVGIDVGDAVRKVLRDHPRWEHAQIRDFLLKEGFDFKGKKPGLSVNMALQHIKRGAKSA